MMMSHNSQKIYRAFISARRAAQRIVSMAKRKGDIARLRDYTGQTLGIKCRDCGAPATEYDHRDYFAPLSVDPVCQSCNQLRGVAQTTLDKLKKHPDLVVINPYPSRGKDSKFPVLRCVNCKETWRTRSEVAPLRCARCFRPWNRKVKKRPKRV